MPLLIFPPPFLAATDWARLFADKLQPPSQPKSQHQPVKPQPQQQPQPPSQQDDEDDDETVVPIRKPS